MSGKRKTLTLAEKVDVLRLLDAGRSGRAVSRKLGCGKTQINSIRAAKAEILKQWDSGASGSKKYLKRKKTKYEELNRTVWDWFCEVHSKDVAISGRLIQEKAKMLSVEMGHDNFSASNGWLKSWQKRYKVSLQNLHGVSTELPDDKSFSRNISPIPRVPSPRRMSTGVMPESQKLYPEPDPSGGKTSTIKTEPQKLYPEPNPSGGRTSTIKTSEPRELYPEPYIYDSGHLRVSEIHQIYFEQSGNKDGAPVVFLHGGPGAGTSAASHRFFDPARYRVIALDQRGAGKSLPPAELQDNTTWDLVSDLEKLREHLHVDRWVVFGGSWGATLSLAYAQTHPSKVKALVLRGIFTVRRKELTWYYQHGASQIFPDHFEKYVAPIPEVERYDLMSAYYRYLTGSDTTKQLECAKTWSSWEMATSRIHIDPSLLERAENDQWALQFARIESHYFVHGGFMPSDDYLLDNMDKIRHIPTTIVQGRYDCVCPMDTAWQLHKRWPEADFHIIPDAGHSVKEPGTCTAVLNATDKYANL